MSGAEPPPPHIVVLAGGAGRGMRTGEPKVLTSVFFRPMIHHVLETAMAVPHRSICVVVGAAERRVREACAAYRDVEYFRQETPLGTADAVRAVESRLAGEEGDVLILNADCVLLSPDSIRGLLAAHAESGAACTVATAPPPDLRREIGVLDAAQAAKHPSEGGAAYCFRLPGLFGALRRVAPGGAGREFRLADAAAILDADGAGNQEYVLDEPMEGADIDDLYDLWRVESFMRARFNRALMRRGVTLVDPPTTRIDWRCRIDRDVVIEGGTTVINSILEAGARVESGCRVVDSRIGPDALVRQGTCVEGSRVGRACRLGPYARVRAGSDLGEGVRVGNFVEIKNSTLGAGTKVAHMSYLGDATVGRDVNVGCGFVTCNSDGGPVKQRTVIEDGVFIGGDSQAVAPVTLGARSFVATGTSVTDDVPPDSFVISRGRQVTKAGYAKKYGRANGSAAGRHPRGRKAPGR